MNKRTRGATTCAWAACVLGVCFGLTAAEPQPDALVFYSEECNDCRHMDEVLDELLALYPELYVTYVEESQPGAADLMWTLSSEYGVFPTNFPVIFVGNQVIIGVGRDKELQLRSAVRACVFDGCPSPLARLERDPFPLTTVLTMLAVIVVVTLLLFL